jgi:hypothetical protein
VLRLLKAAAETDNPWRDGKRLLDEAGATTMRLIDLFKRKPAWRRLVLADGKGRYRLNAEFLSPERRRIRLFRKSGPRGRFAETSASTEGRHEPPRRGVPLAVPLLSHPFSSPSIPPLVPPVSRRHPTPG